MSFPAAVMAGIVPMVIYPIFLYWMDRYEKEPLLLIGAAFLWGFIPAAILSLITQLIIGVPFMLLDNTGALADGIIGVVAAPVTEELFKGLAVMMIFFLWRREFDGVFDGIIYGGVVGFGFAAIENVLYFLDGDSTLVFIRAILFGLNHAFFTSLTGIGFGIARHNPNRAARVFAPLAGLILAIGAHAFHNSMLTFSGGAPAMLCFGVVGDWLGIFFVFLTIIFAVRRERHWIIDELREEVGLHTLSANQYEMASSPLGRLRARAAAFITGGPRSHRQVKRYLSTLTELAYKKHARRRRGDAGEKIERIDALRAQAAAASLEVGDLSY